MSGVDADGLYAALVSDPGRLRTLRRMQYRCPHRCLLLDAIAVGETILLHQKRYKYSDAINEQRSSAEGRARHTFDGAEHWRPRSYYLEQSALAYPHDQPTPRLSIQCDHIGVLSGGGTLTLSALDFDRDWQAGHAAVTVRRDGTRYAVH